MGFKWYRAFRQGRENIKDDLLSGRPISSKNVEMVRAVTVKDPRLSIRIIAGKIGLNDFCYPGIFIHIRFRFAVILVRRLCQFWNQNSCCRGMCPHSHLQPSHFLDSVRKCFSSLGERPIFSLCGPSVQFFSASRAERPKNICRIDICRSLKKKLR
ncbi:hypothetical protein NPIL_93171 [Nephila pilipes]|uniref:C3H1-type domain-containing protein n=1 Tax=Nephila pilipes TaxID=299642 RepID=A0A8X6QGJ3_NEPPI|nr:hypothetical protein NPIL_93171 [Nephila pilipes]